MENIAKLLNDYIKSAKVRSLNLDIAHYMLMHIDVLADMRVSDIAEQCHVSSPSVIRFCRELGMEDYKDFRYTLKLQNELNVIDNMHTDNCALAVDDTTIYRSNVSEWIDGIAKSMKGDLLSVDKEGIIRLADDIMKYNTVVFYANGLSTLMGDYLNMRLGFQKKPIISLSSIDERRKMPENKKKTLVVLVSQYGRLLERANEFMPYLEKHADKIWLVTHLLNDAKVPPGIDERLHIDDTNSPQINCHVFIGIAEIIGQYCRRAYDKM